MQGDRGTADRFRDLIERRLLPGLVALGFSERAPGSFLAEGDRVLWLLDLTVAPWSRPSKVCFTAAWGVHVPGLDAVLGDPEPETPTVETCAVSGRLGEREDRLDPRWFDLRALPWPLAGIATTTLTNQFLSAVTSDVMPKLNALDSPAAVQRFLHVRLITGRGVPSAEELRTIRRIAALSLFHGDRKNAARWLDHLEARSAASMAPDLVAERLAPLRERIAS